MTSNAVLLLLALSPTLATAQNWNVLERTDGCKAISYGPIDSYPGAASFTTLADALASIDPGAEISHIDLTRALRDDFAGLQADVRSHFEAQYSEEYAALLASERTPTEWREPILRVRLREALLASRLMAEIRTVLAERMLVVETIEFEKAQILRSSFPEVAALVSAMLNSCR